LLRDLFGDATGGSRNIMKIIASMLAVVFILLVGCEPESEEEMPEPDYVLRDIYYLRGRYFFIDDVFRAQYYPLNEDGTHAFNPERVVGRLDVYRSSFQAADTYEANTRVDPDDPNLYQEYTKIANFKRLVPNIDYWYSTELGWFRLAEYASKRDIIAVAYSIGKWAGNSFEVTAEIGDVAPEESDTLIDVLTLKLIKGDGMRSSHPTWPLAFMNVYSLGGENLVADGLLVRIINTGYLGEDNRFSDGRSYLEKFGLEDEENRGDSYEILDLNPNLVNLEWGELHFPALLPFVYSSIPGIATNDEALKEVYGYELEDVNQNFIADDPDLIDNGVWDVPALYYRSRDWSLIDSSSQFEIHVWYHWDR
jgi:hypothetical protein